MQTSTKNIQSAPRPRESRRSARRPGRIVSEASVWGPVRDGWRQLYGGFYDLGVSVEWHAFASPHTFEWSRSFHPGSLEICLNLAGRASVHSKKDAACLEPLTAGFYLPGKAGLQAWRVAKEQHRFITIEFSRRFLREQLASCDGALHPLVEEFVQSAVCGARLGEVHRLTAAQEQRVQCLLNPPVLQAARPLWYRGEVLQIMAEFFFERGGPDELFCDRQKRLARQRVERVLALLQDHLSEPLSLDEIGRQVGCSPFHLSRTFSREMGLSIPQYLRKLRMERAAELLKSGKYNVTEAALEVGYSSLSHFSQAFCQTMGCCPGLYPLKTVPRVHPATEPASVEEPQTAKQTAMRRRAQRATQEVAG